ncbi:MAG TPA: hypothetical protein VMW08_00430 [Acidimicrobiales bacterium]|nr:hypothetical protein [Acidimicrobiales bacterium]
MSDSPRCVPTPRPSDPVPWPALALFLTACVVVGAAVGWTIAGRIADRLGA